MFSTLSIRVRVIAAMSLLGLLILATGLSGLYGMGLMNASLREIHANTLPSTITIAEAQMGLMRARLVADRVTLHPEAPGIAKTLQRAENFLGEADKSWAAYRALPQNAEEHALALAMDAARQAFLDQAFKPLLAALKAGDAARADQITMTLMQPLYTKFSDSATALTKFQDRSAGEEHIASQATYRQQLWLTIGAIALGVTMIVLTCVSLLRAILQPIRQALAHFDSIAAGNLANTIDADAAPEMAALLRGLAAMQTRLADTVRSVRDGAAAMAGATDEIATGNLDLSRRTEQQAASLEETASSLEQLTATVKQNSDNARQSNQLAQAASAIALKGGGIVGDVVSTMDAIRTASTRIEDIIGVIDSIAFQTNILALNAAVEAARAGEQGRGFAVVASEVRNLAQRSATAAKDVKALIADSVSKVDAGGKLVAEAGTTMDQIVASIGRVSSIIVEISAAGAEQEQGIGQINQAVAALDDMTQQNAALVEEAAAASESLKLQAETLAEVVALFSLADGADAAPAHAQPALRRAPAPAPRPQRAGAGMRLGMAG
jgi:methyl-accepting chemotaxis protein-1 (serine sensor receptor)